MVYEVRREHNLLYILGTYGGDVENENHFEIENDDVNDIIQSKMKLGDVTVDIITGSIKLVDEKYYDIPIKDSYRVKIIKDAKRKLESLVQMYDMIDYIEYIDTNNELGERGIFITHSNREDKYLEILETGDDSLIDMLEKYLNIKDKLTQIKSAKNSFNNILKQVQSVSETDIESLHKIEYTI